MKHSKDDSFHLGDIGQALVERELKRRDYYVLASASYVSGSKAPLLNGGKDSLIAPDMLIAKKFKSHSAFGENTEGYATWAEVKTKLSAGFRKDRNRLEHGFDEKHYEAYGEVERVTGIPVRVFIFELDTLTILHQLLSVLDVSYSRNGLVYFPRAGLRELARVTLSDAKSQVLRFVTDKSKRVTLLEHLNKFPGTKGNVPLV